MVTGKANQNVKRGIAGVCCLAFCLLAGMTVTEAQPASKACLSAKGEAGVIACRRELELAPYDLDIRFALSDALIGLRRHKEAVDVLQEGLARTPGSEQIKKKLSLAESYLEEQQWIEKKRARQAAAADAAATQKLDTETKRNMIRCTKLKGETAFKACNKALKTLPQDSTLHRSKADALMAMDRVTDAVLAYRESLRLAPDDEETSKKLSAAQAKRSTIATQCQQLKGSAALKACDAALLKGAKDEYTLQRRRGDLLLAMQREAEAEEAYRSALALHPDDIEIKEKLDALSKPATVATVDKPVTTRKESKAQEPKVTPPSIATPTSALSMEQAAGDALPTTQTAGTGQPEGGDSTPIASPATSFPSIQAPKRYSNKPLVSGITH